MKTKRLSELLLEEANEIENERHDWMQASLLRFRANQVKELEEEILKLKSKIRLLEKDMLR